MAYDKPKVTIDLEEYNSLLNSDPSDHILMAKEIVAAFGNHKFNIPEAKRELEKKGITINILSNSNNWLEAKDIELIRTVKTNLQK